MPVRGSWSVCPGVHWSPCCLLSGGVLTIMLCYCVSYSIFSPRRLWSTFLRPPTRACAGRCTAMEGSSSTPEAPDLPSVATSARAAPSTAGSTRLMDGTEPALARRDDAALQAAWHELGRPQLYDGPGEQEQKDLGSRRPQESHFRSRGEKAQRREIGQRTLGTSSPAITEQKEGTGAFASGLR